MGPWGKVISGVGVGAGVALAVWWLDTLGIIDRHAFEWGDFATLTTGALAVIGAVWIGLRQVAITERQANISDQQTKILDKQIALQNLSFKADLYDKRVKVFSDVKSYADTIWAADTRSESAYRDYVIALEASKFLFSEEIHGKFREIEKYVNRFTTLAKNRQAMEKLSVSRTTRS